MAVRRLRIALVLALAMGSVAAAFAQSGGGPAPGDRSHLGEAAARAPWKRSTASVQAASPEQAAKAASSPTLNT